MHVQSLSGVQLFKTPWAAACQVPLSMGFSTQEYWSRLPFPPPVDFPNPGIKAKSPVSPVLAGRFFITEPPGKPYHVYTAAKSLQSLQSCPTLGNPIDVSPPGSPIPGILQARTLEWVAISFSNAWKWKVNVKSFSHVWLLATPWTAAHQAPPSMGFFQARYWTDGIYPQ